MKKNLVAALVVAACLFTAFVAGAWWQYGKCEARNLKAQDKVLNNDGKEFEKLKKRNRSREGETRETIQIIDSSPASCLGVNMPDDIVRRLPINPRYEEGPTPNRRLQSG